MAERGKYFNPEDFFAHRNWGGIYVGNDEVPLELPPDGGKIISIADGVSPFGPPEDTQKIFEELVDNKKFLDAISTYDLGTTQAEQNIRDRFDLPTEQKVFLSSGGSDEIIERITFALDTGVKKRVWAIVPTFPDMDNYIDRQTVQGKESERLIYGPIYVPLNSAPQDQLQIAKERLIKAKRDRMKPAVYFCNPGTPKGDIVINDEVEGFVEFAEANGNLVIIDEAFLAEDKDSAAPLTQKYSNLIVTGSLSKAIALPGAGIGYMLASKGLEPFLEEFNRPYHVRGVSALMANYFTKPDLIRKHQTKVRNLNIKNKNLFKIELEREGFKIMGRTNMKSLIMAVNSNTADFYNKLRRQGVDTTRGGGFESASTEGPSMPNINDSIVRVTTPKNELDIPVLVRRFVAAKNS